METCRCQACRWEGYPRLRRKVLKEGFHVGAYCRGCSRWIKWMGQSAEVLAELEKQSVENSKWVKLVLRDLIQDLDRARGRLELIEGEEVGCDATRAISRISPHTLVAYKASAQEALAALEKEL